MIFDVVGFLGSYMARYVFLMTLVVSDDAVKFTSETHDPCARTVTYKREENKNTLRKAPVWSRPNTLRRLNQKYSHNSRVLERVNYAYLDVRRVLGLL